MDNETKVNLLNTIDTHGGLEETFIYWDDFLEIEDPEFHKQREEFVAAWNKFALHVGWIEE